MKRYVPIVIGVVALCVILFIGNDQMKSKNDTANEEQKTEVALTSFSGKVTRMYEGENVLEYGFDVPASATTTVEKDGALVKVTDNGVPLVAAYFSYEGGRGYSPEDYITNNIVPSVAAVTDMGTTTVGSHEWTVAESEWSVWHVAKSSNGQWLIVVENKKTDTEKAKTILESLTTK